MDMLALRRRPRLLACRRFLPAHLQHESSVRKGSVGALDSEAAGKLGSTPSLPDSMGQISPGACEDPDYESANWRKARGRPPR